MRCVPLLLVSLGVLVSLAPAARAEDPANPRNAVPLGAPPAPRYVPVPDVRGLGEVEARRALEAAGLRMGGVERVAVAQLEAELGRTYSPGQVVQQAPRPSTGDEPSWQPRGAPVWLRVAAGRGTAGTAAVPVPQPAPPAVPRAPRTVTGGVDPYPPQRIPPPPPPPYGTLGSRQPVVGQPPMQPAVPAAPVPPTQPAVPVEPRPEQPVYEEPPLDPYYAPEGEAADPYADGTYWPGDLRSRIALPCERGQERWHVRPLGGASFWLGDDEGDVDFYAGIDVGRIFSNCIGVDVFYRYSAGTFDRDVPGGLLEDAGTFHHVGLKVTYNSSFTRGGRIFGFVGLGAGWFTSQDLANDDDGFGGFGEAGVGFLVDNNVRIRVGVNVHALDTDAGRFLPADDGDKRLLWLVAPTLALELDI